MCYLIPELAAALVWSDYKLAPGARMHCQCANRLLHMQAHPFTVGFDGSSVLFLLFPFKSQAYKAHIDLVADFSGMLPFFLIHETGKRFKSFSFATIV